MHDTTFQSYFSNLEGPIDIEALLAFHQRTFAGYTLEADDEGSEEPAGEDTDQESSKSDKQDNESDEEQADDDEKGAESDDDEESEEESKLSPEDAVKVAKKARQEAANWRTKFRDLEKQLADAKTPEQVEALVAEMKTEREQAEQALVVENVALKHRLPEDLAQVLVDASAGKTREQLEAHAKVLAKYAPADDGDETNPSGGLDPTDDEGAFDAAKVAAAARSRRY